MCIEDIRLGRLMRASQSSHVITTTPQVVLGADKDRTFIILPSTATAGVFYSISPNMVTTDGFFVAPGVSPLLLHVKDYGDLVTKQFLASVAAGTEPLVIWFGSLSAQ